MNMNKLKVCMHLTKKMVDGLQQVKVAPRTCSFPHKAEEVDSVPLWYCLHCGVSGCSRYSLNKCMEAHNAASRHALCVNFEEGKLWCYDCDEELHELVAQNMGQEQVSRAVKDFTDRVELVDCALYKLRSKDGGNSTTNKLNHNHNNKGFGLANASPMLIEHEKQDEEFGSETGESSRAPPVKDHVFGLKNLGNTCFFNSVFQILLASEAFIACLKQSAKSLGGQSLAAQIVSVLEDSSEQVRNPKGVFSKLVSQKKMYGFYHQQDSHECFVNLVEILEAESRGARLPLDLPFYGYLIYNCFCLSCRHSEWIFEDSTNLMLDLNPDLDHREVREALWKAREADAEQNKQKAIANSEIMRNKNVEKSGFDLNSNFMLIDLERELAEAPAGAPDTDKLLDNFFDFKIHTRGKDSYECERCKSASDVGFNKHYFVRTPQILVICLKKFDKTFAGVKKHSKSVSCSAELDLSKYAVLRDGVRRPEELHYELYGAVQHSGSLHGGHYVCYVKKESGCWYYVSDSHFSKVAQSAALNSDAYLLFYRRKA